MRNLNDSKYNFFLANSRNLSFAKYANLKIAKFPVSRKFYVMKVFKNSSLQAAIHCLYCLCFRRSLL